MFLALRFLLMLLFVSSFAQCALAQGVEDEERGSASFDKLVNVGGGRRLHINCSGLNLKEAPRLCWNRAPETIHRFGIGCSPKWRKSHVSAPTTAAALAAAIRFPHLVPLWL